MSITDISNYYLYRKLSFIKKIYQIEKEDMLCPAPLTQKLLQLLLSAALLGGLHAAPALAETTDTSTVVLSTSLNPIIQNWKKLMQVYFCAEDGTILKSQITYGDDKYYVDETALQHFGLHYALMVKTWYLIKNFFHMPIQRLTTKTSIINMLTTT